MKKFLLLACLLMGGCWYGPHDSHGVVYDDDYTCEIDVWEYPFTQEICEEVWCYDSYYDEWYLYDEYCY